MSDWTSKICDLVHQCGVIDAVDIPFDREVRNACKMNYCGNYNKSWSCPPAIGDLDDIIDMCKRRTSAIIFSTKHQLEDSFDFEGMMRGRIEHESVYPEVFARLSLENTLLLGAGCCKKCEQCTYPTEPCRHPESLEISMEAAGVDVLALSRLLGINYHNGANTVTYFSAILFD